MERDAGGFPIAGSSDHVSGAGRSLWREGEHFASPTRTWPSLGRAVFSSLDGAQKARKSPVGRQKGPFLAEKERFFHSKISSFLRKPANAILYFQRHTGFDRHILTSFSGSASLDAPLWPTLLAVGSCRLDAAGHHGKVIYQMSSLSSRDRASPARFRFMSR